MGSTGKKTLTPTRARAASSSRGSRGARGAALALGLMVVASSLAASCSLIVDTNAEQCTSNADCVAKGAGFEGTTCGADHICATLACSTNKECIDSHGGEPWICRKTDRKCGALLSQDCKLLLPNDAATIANDDVVWFGTLLPIVGDDASTGLPNENGIELARRDFANTTNGLPPVAAGKARRPFAFVACNDAADADRAALHLTDDVGVPAIIGPAFSGTVIKVATDVTIPRKVLMISNSATSPFITHLANKNDLVWRTCPSDAVQSVAISLLMQSRVEPDLRVTELKSSDTLRLAVVHKGDAYGTGMADALFDKLVFNGKSAAANGIAYKAIDYGDPSKPDAEARYKNTVDQLIAFQPHVVIIVGTSEGVVKVFGPLETAWPASIGFKPRYVLSDGCEIPELLGIIGSNAELRKRILGTVPGTTSKLLDRFASHYRSTFTDGTMPDQYTAAAYDATYVLAYATVAITPRNLPITGPNLVEGLKKLVPPGPQIDVGPESMNSAFDHLMNGENIDYNGASGPLDFDVTVGEAESDIQIWCADVDARGTASTFKNSGEFYDAITKKLAGSIACP